MYCLLTCPHLLMQTLAWGKWTPAEFCSLGTVDELCFFLFRNTTGVTEEALKEFSMMFK